MYVHVIVAGTFDRLHKGHEAVLTKAFAIGERITIGLTSDLYVKKFKKSVSMTHDSQFPIQEFEIRKKNLLNWLIKKELEDRATIVPIYDPYGSSLTESFDALIVTKDNKKTGEEINQRRKKKGLAEVVLIEVPFIPAEDLSPIASTRIRKKEIDREGRLIMPDSLRPQLQQPLGRVLTGEEITKAVRRLDSRRRNDKRLIITVGDVTTKTFLDAGVIPSLAIIDFQVERKPYPDLHQYLDTLMIYIIKVKSGPGYISQEAIEVVKQWSEEVRKTSSRPPRLDPVAKTWIPGPFEAQGKQARNDNVVIIVDGEEDLLALPAIAYAPVGRVVYYGQPRLRRGKPGTSSVRGMVEVVVTKENKKKAVALLKKFTIQ